ncbi:hypothetical protein ISN44_As10g005970 [Arabidopsis suecica]|uniref:DUF4283 domain-containing protein n=1 Tax=Arabidopsis suecica TaxID=45249 RepID=A0A8T1ZVA4_ARASU|nr:hypothetical protein ISN44_As10g005970 [Arabidopsis suecica]
MREKRLWRFWRLYRFSFFSYLFVSLSECRRRLSAVFSGIDNCQSVTSITESLGKLFIPCDCLCELRVDQSEFRKNFPLFILIMADKIRRQLQEIALGIDDEIINLPSELCEEAINETRFSLVAKPVNARKQNLRAMLTTLPRLWGVSEEVTGQILENRKIQFLFQSDEVMASILRRGPWSFNDWMCVTEKWNPDQSDEDLKHIAFWVQIRGIPLHFLTARMVTHIGENLGHFMETDFVGDGAILVDFVRVRLLCHIDVPLRFQRKFQFGNQACILKLRYEKLRNFCSVCGLITHDAADCPSGNNPPPPPEEDDDEDPYYNPEDTETNPPEEP